MLPPRYSNANLHFTYTPVFNGLRIQEDYLPMASEYLQALYDTMHKALDDYPRVLAVRIDPVIPTEISDRQCGRIINGSKAFTAAEQSPLNV